MPAVRQEADAGTINPESDDEEKKEVDFSSILKLTQSSSSTCPHFPRIVLHFFKLIFLKLQLSISTEPSKISKRQRLYRRANTSNIST